MKLFKRNLKKLNIFEIFKKKILIRFKIIYVEIKKNLN